MGSFQVVYDDFSGGQYMGPRPANQPKNTWSGNDVLPNPNGELIPSGSRAVGTYTATLSGGTIVDHWVVSTTGYFFTGRPRMVKYEHNNGAAFPVTMTNYAMTGLTGTMSSVTYSVLHGRFYVLTISGSSGTVWNVTTTGTVTSFSTALSSGSPQGITTYKQRLLVWGTNRLYYSGVWTGTAYGALSTAQYYELDSRIIAVYPRTDDLLIVCEDGTFSLTGIFGVGVTIQTLTPGSNVASGMKTGDVVNRSLFYVDELTSYGSLDGRLYRMVGASMQQVASFEYGDYPYADNGYSLTQPGIVTAMPNGRIAIQFRNGVTYFETTPGVFAKSDVFDIEDTSTTRATSGLYRMAKAGPNAPDEYMLTAVLTNPAVNDNVTVYRTYTNVPAPTKLDANFNFSTNSTCTVNPTGTVELSEYWHSRPFTVKEVFIEYSVTTGGSVSCTIIPTGVVDVPAANLASVVSTAASETSPPAGGYRMYRYWPNNASKGFGAKPQLTITNCFVKRVIMNCED
jgi:hypothetical protein